MYQCSEGNARSIASKDQPVAKGDMTLPVTKGDISIDDFCRIIRSSQAQRRQLEQENRKLRARMQEMEEAARKQAAVVRNLRRDNILAKGNLQAAEVKLRATEQVMNDT